MSAVAVKLEGACFNDNFNLPALPPGRVYNGPGPDGSNTCQCSTVSYSVVQACAACQGGSFTLWQTWSMNCQQNHISVGSYPNVLVNVSVPAWAFVDVTKSGVFNVTLAETLSKQPESTLAPPPASTSGSSSSSPSTSNTSGASSSKSSNHTGAIVGGVIGGIVGLALICIGAFIVYRRQRKSRRSQPRSIQEKVDMTQPNYRYTDSYSLSPPKLYDPADPTTFPQSPAPTFFTGTTSPPPTSPGHRHGNSSGSYSGFPEL